METLGAILSVSTMTTYLVAGLTIACAILFLFVTGSRSLTLMFTPVAAFGALIGIFASREMGLYYSTDQDSNVMLSGILGMIVGLIIVILAARLTYVLVGALRSSQSRKLHQRTPTSS